MGWQSQQGCISVQSTLAQAAYALCGKEILFNGAGRTDKGVHALGQVAHGDFHKEFTLDALRRGLNFYLKDKPVSILAVARAEPEFDARFSAIFRRYQYRILNRPSATVLKKDRVWWIPQPLNSDAMTQAASFFTGHHDFSLFRHSFCQAQSPWKTVDCCTLEPTKGPEWIITVQARSFLHRQVRMMVGALVAVGRGFYPPSLIPQMLKGIQPKRGVVTAPSWGLYLDHVGYDQCSWEKL